MNQEEKNQALRNKAVRGYIIRSLVKGFNNKVSRSARLFAERDFLYASHTPCSPIIKRAFR